MVATHCTEARLDELIEEATVGWYNESEQISGFYTMLQDHLTVPSTTKVLGMDVVVEEIDITEDEKIVAVCAWQPAPADSCAGFAVATSSTRRLEVDRCIPPLGALEMSSESRLPKLERISPVLW